MKRPNNNSLKNGIKMEYPKSALHLLFLEQAEQSPNSIALEFEQEKITYGELAKRINQTANYFLEQGLTSGQFVAVSMDRNPNLIVSLLAILQCGAAYLPLDPKFPTERLEFMLEDSDASFLLTTKALSDLLPKNSKTILIEDVLISIEKFPASAVSKTVSPESVAYMMYTSGSTGKPKGVTVTHQNLVNFLYSMAVEPGIKPEDKLLSITTISFDIAGLELFLPLIKGASVVFADYETTRDGQLLFNLLKKKEITILQATPTTWQLLLDSGWNSPLTLKALCGGEAMPLNLARQLTARCESLWNMYGPTETTIWSAVKQVKSDDELITIGLPIANTQIYLLNEKGEVVKEGEIGEIVIGGDGVAQGYWKRPELTAEKFISDTFSTESNAILYRTGDLGKLLPNGEFQCLGRIDHQVKLRGHRIELGEIEATLNTLPGVKQSAVIVSNHFGNEDKLVAYLKSELLQDEKKVQEALSKVLPEILIPSKYIFVDEFPITPNGKIDKKNLPLPENSRPDSAPLFKKPTTQLERDIAQIWSEELKIAEIGIDDDFFDMGGSSVLAQKVTTLLKQRLSLEIPVSKIYIYPTIKELSSILEEHNSKEETFEFKKSNENLTSQDIAIIGMAGRFPGSDTIEELWENLRDGKETISLFSKEELDPSLPESLRNDPLYIGARGILPSAKTFDPQFFGLNPQLAAAMDPQIRIFMEISYEALEQAGHLPKHYKGSIGVYSGSEINSYFDNNLFLNKELKSSVGDLQIYTVNGKDFIAPRTSYHLNLKGPSVSVHSACSTSLLAVAEAVKAIRTGMCDVALAGGSSVTAPLKSGHLYDDGFIKSPDGSTRSFDASGKGTVFSDGAGVVLLKRLEEAEKDGDIIYGVIKGVGVNNDGGDKGSFMAPSPKGQAGAIINAFNDAQISPSTISYMEAHGTATPIGDPIEIEGLKIAYGKQEKKNYCALGTIKSNMGHTTAAAGVAGLIKTLLAMQHKQIPPMVNFVKPNPNIDFDNSPFYINNKLIDWKADGKRRAGISSFGIGSTNVHVIVEEYEAPKAIESSAGRPLQLLNWSAKSQNSLLAYENALGHFIDKSKNIPLADIAYSLNITREDFNQRSFLIANSTEDAAEKLMSLKTKNTKTSTLKSVPNEIGFLFPGQGSQYLQMGKTLYDNEIVYRNAVDKCAELLMEELELDIRDILYPKSNFEDAEALLRNTRLTQPSLFVTEYALSQLWMSWGIKPTFLCGHSIGEFAAAHLAGILTLKDALHIVAARGRLISQLPGGSMLIVRVPVDQLKELIPDTLSIAAINSNQFCVASGKKEDIALFNKELDAKEIPNKLLNTSHAFHSFMMEPILEEFKKELQKVKLSIPRLPIISTASGTWLKDTEATDPDYWVNHLKNTVRFADAMDTAFEMDNFLLLEVGPGQTLITLARQQAAGKIIPAFASITPPKEEQENEYNTLLTTLGDLWLRGLNPDWKSFHNQQKRQKIELPSYIFDRKPCWIEPLGVIDTMVVPKTVVAETPMTEVQTEEISTKSKGSRKDAILSQISEIIKNASGIVYDIEAAENTFLELGLDSLSLTQLSGKLKKEFDLPITFRQLNEAYSTPSLLADYIELNLPEETPSEKQEKETETIAVPVAVSNVTNNEVPLSGQNQASLEQIIKQIQLLSQKVDQLQNLQNSSVNGNGTFVNLKVESFDSIKFNNDNKVETNGKNGTNGVHKTNGISKNEKNFDISKIHNQQSENKTLEKKYIIKANEPPVQGSKLGRDENGNPAWFIEDPNQNGNFVKIKL